MDTTIDLKKMFSGILKKWPVLVAFVLAGAVVFNVYGYRKASASADSANAAHERYAAAAADLPWYYTESIYELRSSLSDNDAAYVEAVAGIFRNFMLKYGVQNDLINGSVSDVEDSSDLANYITFVASIKDIKSAMSSTQLQYFNALSAVELDIAGRAGETGAMVQEYVPASAGALQGKWLVIGAVIGAFFGAALLSLPTLLRKRG